MILADPPKNCSICPRLTNFRDETAARHPDWYNGAVPDIGDTDARLLIVGLAPGLRGGNRTGIPFTGDASGEALFATMRATGFANAAETHDAPNLHDCVITNAVRCVPPANKPTASEINACRTFLAARIKSLPNLRAILCLGRVSHDSTCRTLGLRLRDHPFTHGARHDTGHLAIFDTYHCSRYNLNTGRLSLEMFEAVFIRLRAYIGAV